MKRKPSEIMPRLLEWQQVHSRWMEQYRALQALTNCGPEAPIALAMGMMWDAYSAAIAREVGDAGDWLDWHCWENDMGSKGLQVFLPRRKPLEVKTIAQLARVICA